MAFNPDCPELKNLDDFRKALPQVVDRPDFAAIYPWPTPIIAGVGHPPIQPASSPPSPFPPTPGELLRNGWQATTPERKAEIRREGAKILTNMSHAPRADVLAALERAYGLEP